MSDQAQDRAELAAATMERIFGVRPNHEPGPGEPESGRDVRGLLFEHAFADSWTRTAISDQSRSLVTLAVLATLGAERELRVHTHGALGIGVTPDQLADVMLHVGAYAGVARGDTAWRIVSDALATRASRANRGDE